jgi:hypothetical protein
MNRRLWTKFAIFIGIALLLGAQYWAWDHRGYWLIDNFREVEPGRIYAGGYQYSWPLRRIIDRYGIKTVVSLREGDDSFELDERRVLESKGVQFRNIVIPFRVPDAERIAAIESAIETIADEQNQPVFVHCWAGCHRTGSVVAIYRVSRCNWTEQEARKELIDWGGTSRGTQWPTRVLSTYCSRNQESVADNTDTGALR